MATKIPTEIVIKILNNVQSTKDLYSSLLVNRIWCKVTIPILWELPLSQKCCTDNKLLKKKALCIRTYISCMNTQTRTLLIQNGFDLSLSPPQATFDYPSFTHKFIINNLVYFISIYSQQIIRPDQDNNNEVTITKSRILFREICKFIINSCTFLDCFKLMGVPKNYSKNFRNYVDLIGSILELPGAPKVFKKLESFTSMMTEDDEPIRPLYEPLTLICDNILNMDLSLNTHSQMQLLVKLVSVQKRLENLSIVSNYYQVDLLFWAIISQKETLKSLRLCSIRFHNFKGKSPPIRQFVSLQELYIENCLGLIYLECSLASSFTQLSSFHYLNFRHTHNKYPQEFIIKIFETANTNLRNICLDLHPTFASDTFSAILIYCTKITKLTLHNLCREQVIAIFNNNFNELRRFSFDCGEEGFDANELLCQIAKNIPKSLETIKIRMDYKDPWIFSANSLRKFFEGWCCKEGGNKKLRRLRIKRSLTPRDFLLPTLKFVAINSEHFKVIEEYGIQFDMK